MINRYRLIFHMSGHTVATVTRIEGWWAKGWGALGRTSLPMGEGIWMPGVASVHTLGIRFPLDILFLDKDFQTIHLAPSTPPGRWWISGRGASHTIELGAGTLDSRIFEINIKDPWLLEPI